MLLNKRQPIDRPEITAVEHLTKSSFGEGLVLPGLRGYNPPSPICRADIFK